AFTFQENLGDAMNPIFGAAQKNPFMLDSISGDVGFPDFADLDGDGDLDLMVGSYPGNFFYYENEVPVAAMPEFSLGDGEFFPNPVSEDLHIRLNAASALKKVQVEVYNVTGQRLLYDEIAVVRGRLDHVVDASDLPAGAYMLRLRARDQMVSKRIVVK
ncbi:MAG: T9SS type A sorting domain-containing protein, partial [Bacteroidota bacterium]